jgi:hypothetical protein
MTVAARLGRQGIGAHAPKNGRGRRFVAQFLLILQTLILVAGLALLGQGVVGAFNWKRRHENIVYQLLGLVAKPAVWLVRRLTPRIVVDQHIPLATFMLLFFAYLAVGFWQRDVCLKDLTQSGCERWVAARAGGTQ